MKYRKKPVIVEAEQYVEEVNEPEGLCWKLGCGADCPHVHTLEGPLLVKSGDYIITGVKGEKYPCKSDIFEATYERVDLCGSLRNLLQLLWRALRLYRK